MKMQKLGLILSLVMVLGGCATSQEELLPDGDMTMSEIWAEKSGGGQSGLQEARNALHFVRPIDSNLHHSAQMTQYTRTASNEATNLFPRLPNPDLTMFVFPHLTNNREQLPIPGYSTVFPFYGRVQYAQPGERTANY